MGTLSGGIPIAGEGRGRHAYEDCDMQEIYLTKRMCNRTDRCSDKLPAGRGNGTCIHVGTGREGGPCIKITCCSLTQAVNGIGKGLLVYCCFWVCWSCACTV